MRAFLTLAAIIAAAFSYYTWKRDPYEHRAYACSGRIKSELRGKITESDSQISVKFSITNPKFYWDKSKRDYYGRGAIIFYFSKINDDGKMEFYEEILSIDKGLDSDIIIASTPNINKDNPDAEFNYNVVGNDLSFKRHTRNIDIWPNIFINAQCTENIRPIHTLKYGIG